MELDTTQHLSLPVHVMVSGDIQICVKIVISPVCVYLRT